MNPRNYLLLAGFLASVGLGYWACYKINSRPVTSTDTNSSTTTRDIVIEKRPDGTVVERRRETESARNRRTIIAKPQLPKWSVGASVQSPLSKLSDYTWTASLYRRIGDTNLWAGLGGSNNREVSIGLRIDF